MMTRKDSMVLGSVCLVAGAAFAAATPAQAGIFFFSDQAAFDAALADAGKVLKGSENFPWLALPNSVIGTPDPVDVNGSQPGWYVPGMLIDNLAFQSNEGGADSSQTTPNAPDGIALLTTGFLGAVADGLVTNTFVKAFDILSGSPGGANHTAMGMTTTTFLGGNSVRVDVYDKNNVLIGNLAAHPSGVGGSFLGILTTGGDTIGRVNLFDAANGAEGIYDIAVYIPGPGSLALLGLAGLLGRRRRRRS